jgi:CRISPR-associated endonuclease/helicase Cas3
MKYLLAKSYNAKIYPDVPPDYALLSQHSRDVASACAAIADEVGKIALTNSGLDDKDFDSFREELKANGWIQDLGKANSHFQEMVSGKLEGCQLLRHETISGLLVFAEKLPIQKLLSEKFSEMTLLRIVWAAMGHHRKFDNETQAKQALRLQVFLSCPDFKTILEEMRQDLGLSKSINFDKDVTITESYREDCDFNAHDELRKLQDFFDDNKHLFTDVYQKRRLALTKGLGIAADVAASAIAKKEKSAQKYSLPTFIQESFRVGLKPNDFLSITGKVTPYPFQQNVGNSSGYLTFAQAGCGSGKSLAAYLWAQNWCRRFTEEGRTNFRLFFCLPTTGTTTEQFKDYALESGIPPEMLSLTHSRASVDLQTIAQTDPQEEAGENSKNPAQDVLRAEQDKIESLALWNTPLVVTTSDTVLGLMANARRSIYSLPAIMCGAIVFDEVHAFDDQMFGHLLVFLKNFPKLPILLMTASLPEKKLEAIKKVRSDFTAENCIEGDKDFAELERYKIQEVFDENEIWQAVEECVANNGKVLWVRNQVDWANDIYKKCLTGFVGINVNVYHSRLKYEHRSERHRRVIDDFKRETSAAILVATQVAEMSLDLSADLLITDIAPIPSLIQRMGRLNRRLNPKTEKHLRKVKPALVNLLPEDEQNSLPYEIEELKTAREWISKLRKDYGDSLSQKDLADCFAEFSDEREFDIQKAEERAVFFSGLWQTRPGMTRGEGYTISVILEDDCAAWKQKNGAKEPDRDWLRRHEVAVPIKNEIFKWEVFGGLRVAENEFIAYDYDEQTREGTGAKWRNK